MDVGDIPHTTLFLRTEQSLRDAGATTEWNDDNVQLKAFLHNKLDVFYR